MITCRKIWWSPINPVSLLVIALFVLMLFVFPNRQGVMVHRTSQKGRKVTFLLRVRFIMTRRWRSRMSGVASFPMAWRRMVVPGVVVFQILKVFRVVLRKFRSGRRGRDTCFKMIRTRFLLVRRKLMAIFALLLLVRRRVVGLSLLLRRMRVVLQRKMRLLALFGNVFLLVLLKRVVLMFVLSLRFLAVTLLYCCSIFRWVVLFEWRFGQKISFLGDRLLSWRWLRLIFRDGILVLLIGRPLLTRGVPFWRRIRPVKSLVVSPMSRRVLLRWLFVRRVAMFIMRLLVLLVLVRTRVRRKKTLRIVLRFTRIRLLVMKLLKVRLLIVIIFCCVSVLMVLSGIFLLSLPVKFGFRLLRFFTLRRFVVIVAIIVVHVIGRTVLSLRGHLRRSGVRLIVMMSVLLLICRLLLQCPMRGPHGAHSLPLQQPGI